MSKQRDCYVLEPTPGEWYCIVATGEHGRITPDKTGPEPTTYGPKPTEEEAYSLMNEYEANPGGYYCYPHGKMDAGLRHLLVLYPPDAPPLRLSDLTHNQQQIMLDVFRTYIHV